MPRRHALLAAPVLALLLAGCVPTPVGTADPQSPPASPTSTSAPTPSATATATPTPGADTEPVGLGCGDVISAQAIYDFNPNVSLLADFSPIQGTPAAQAVAQQGISCRLVNQTSGEVIDIGVVRFTESGFAAKAAALASSATDSPSFDGYFDIVDGSGLAQAVSKPYWVFVNSAAYRDPADLAPLVSAVTGSLG